jgi:hypothetical protein
MKTQLAALLLAIASVSAPLVDGEPTHATRGVVKSAAPSEIVVARAKNRGDIRIELLPDTHVDGTIRVGVIVSVRYHEDHGRHVATAVAVEREVNGN